MDDFIPTSDGICIYKYNKFRAIESHDLKVFSGCHS